MNTRGINERLLEYKPSGLRRVISSVTLKDDAKSETNSVFIPSQDLGIGAFATVRKFKNNRQEDIAVKKPHNYSFRCNQVKNELLFFHTAYPDKSPYEIVMYENPRDYRLILPFIPGDTLDIFLKNHMPHVSLSQTFLAIAKELQRLHSISIIHGDIKHNNILLSQDAENIIIHFIDFYWSYASDQELALSTPANCVYWPPERTERIQYGLMRTRIFFLSPGQ